MSTKFTKIIAIGTSTGGPKALQEVLTKLPKGFHAPILIVQHMPPGFTKSLANRLNDLCEIDVVEASHGEEIKPSTAYIAPGNYHMSVSQRTTGELFIVLDQERPPKGGHRPSVDLLFESLAKISHLHKYVVVMTGMGKDGTEGMIKIREEQPDRVTFIAEDESTCVVYGMPRAAVGSGLVNEIIPLHKIGNYLTHNIMKQT